VEAAIVGEEVAEVEFHAVADKAGRNIGGGSCFLREPGSQAMRVPALSIRKLWREQHIDRCDLLSPIAKARNCRSWPPSPGPGC
jgi:hypothetical protein